MLLCSEAGRGPTRDDDDDSSCIVRQIEEEPGQSRIARCVICGCGGREWEIEIRAIMKQKTTWD